MKPIEVPFFRPDIGPAEIDEVTRTLRSGWLTTGPQVRRFEGEFAAAVGAAHAIALNSCTAALHLAVDALGLKPRQGVLVPTMTFAATAEVVRYLGATPILVDCDPQTGNMDLADAQRRVDAYLADHDGGERIVGIMPVHVGGLMMDVAAIAQFAAANQLWTVEDAAHAFPAAWRPDEQSAWRRCGEASAMVTCFSFYANKTITTGEGGMAVTNHPLIADRMRLMSLHGLSHDAWGRYSGKGSWDYRIVAPGYKYNMTDLAAALGVQQLMRAEEMRRRREYIAKRYLDAFSSLDEIELPSEGSNRIHAWHLFPLKLNLGNLSISRDQLLDDLRTSGVSCSVHWRPLHLHPYYADTYGHRPEDYPNATEMFRRTISLPLFPAMSEREIDHVIDTVALTIRKHTAIRRARTA
jgi:perosamine synthetase